VKDRFAGQVYFNIDVLYDGSQRKIIPAGVTEHEKRFFERVDWLPTLTGSQDKSTSSFYSTVRRGDMRSKKIYVTSKELTSE
jgi:hypothetical protein